jgi:hypothetical protein
MSEVDQTSFWKTHADARKGQGISRAAYCRENNLVESRLYYWEWKILGLRKKKCPVGGSVFAPIVVEGNDGKSNLVSIRLSGGIEIILEKLPEVDWVLKLNKLGATQ